MDLIRHKPALLQIEGKLNRILQGGPGVGGNEIGYQVLLLPYPFVGLLIFPAEGLEDFLGRLSHPCQHPRRDMLRCHFQSATDVVSADFFHEFAAGVCHHVIIAYAGTNKHFFDPRQFSDAAKKVQIALVVNDELFAGLGIKAFLVLAHSGRELLVASRAAEICRRAADVVNISLEIRSLRQGLRFCYNGILASPPHFPTLMIG